MTDDAPQLRGEPRKLSSVDTEGRATVAFFIAAVCVVGVLVSIVVGKFGVALVLVGVIALIWFAVLVVGPKVVETDGYWLLATDLSKTVWIPLRHIVAVDQGGFPGSRRIYVKLGCDTPFGREIVFEPQFGLGPLIGEHPVVGELRELAARARAAHSRPGPRAG